MFCLLMTYIIELVYDMTNINIKMIDFSIIVFYANDTVKRYRKKYVPEFFVYDNSDVTKWR
jgi:hypothetical protein